MSQALPALPQLRLRLFGPFDAWVEGAPLPRLRSRKGQWLLALLALRHGRPVERTWLAAALWPESSESQGLANLRLSLTDLRHAMGPAASRLRAPTPYTLVFDLRDADADVVAFDTAIERGDTASLESTVSIDGGSLLEGCLTEWAVQEREPREQAYLAALDRLAEHSLARCAPDEAVRLMRLAISHDPLRETAHRRLMRALAISRDWAGALVAYRELRLLLRRVLGTDPDEQTTSFFEQIRRDSRNGAVLEPLQIAPVEGPPNNLPSSVTSFVGRAEDIRKIKALLATSRMVTLRGIGGCGKTRLAIEAEDCFCRIIRTVSGWLDSPASPIRPSSCKR